MLVAPDNCVSSRDLGAEILVTVLIPFGVYLVAERMQASGVLAAAAAGIAMSFTRAVASAAARVRATAVWDMLQFAANGAIFVLLGMQLPAILSAAEDSVQMTGHTQPWWLAVLVAAIVIALGLLRFTWVWVSIGVRRVHGKLRGEERELPGALPRCAVACRGARRFWWQQSGYHRWFGP